MFIIYKLEEASVASAVINTFPVFVALLAMPFLGKLLSMVCNSYRRNRSVFHINKKLIR
jgi:uncharacterized membrane protein